MDTSTLRLPWPAPVGARQKVEEAMSRAYDLELVTTLNPVRLACK